MNTALKDDFQKITVDYSDSLHQVVFILGRCDATAHAIFTKYTAHWPVPEDRQTLLELDTQRVVVYIPIQVIPEIVRELGQSNIAVYQVISPDLLGLS